MDTHAPRTRPPDATREWLEADGLGAFAMGTPSGIRTRRYHGLLSAAQTPPTRRVMLVNALEAWLELDGRRVALSSHAYDPDVVHPDGASRLASFEAEPCPTRTWDVGDGLRVVERTFVRHGSPLVVVTWRLEGAAKRFREARLEVRPLLSGRDLHGLHHESPAFGFDAWVDRRLVRWAPYPDLPAVLALWDGVYRHDPAWYRSFRYDEERARGYDYREDLAAPGVLSADLRAGEAALVLAADAPPGSRPDAPGPAAGHGLASFHRAGDLLRRASSAAELARALWDAERERRERLGSPLSRAADAYLVRRGEGLTVVAGYPWFADWGRDTFLSLRGLCLATGRLDEALAILLEWSGLVSRGMLPNRFAEFGEEPEYNSVDASLWFAIAVHDLFAAFAAAGRELPAGARGRLERAVAAILWGYAAGTRYGIRAELDGLLACGEEGTQLTWMDAKVDGRVITPRAGKPVEVQALWINALRFASGFEPGFEGLAARAARSFEERFWNEEAGCLDDVVDADPPGPVADASVRPNQILAVGGLPWALLEGERARRVVDLVEARLWTPLGLRTLDPADPRYHGVYAGGPVERDEAYHQGTAWPWLIGPFVEAWLRVRGSGADARREARERFLQPLLEHLAEAGLGHVSEVADGDAPHRPGGCPFQAWSVGELLRAQRLLEPEPRKRERARAARG